jgi:predicted phosphodiesterase
VVLSDVHCPFEDRRAIDIVCEVIADLRPHGLVLNGDIADLPEVSRHSAGSVAMLEGKRISETFAATKKFVERVTAAAGERCTKKHFIFGNHEDRLRRWLNSGDNAVFAGDEGFDLRIRFGLAANGYIVHDDYPESHIRLGKLLVTHGKYEGKHCAHKHLDEYQTSILVGHTHTVQIYHGSTWDGQRVAVCQGMLGDTETEAFSYKKPPRRWVTGFSVVHVAPDGRFWINLLNIFGGELHYGGKKYPR